MDDDTFTYFGIKFDEKKTNKHIDISNLYLPNSDKGYTKIAVENCKKNYDINMNYFTSLDPKDFDHYLNKLVSKFTKITNLKQCESKKGIYVLVLKKFNQIYIGQSSCDLKRRIMRHWTRKLKFSEMHFIFSSILSIDCFGPLDTTDIYVYYTNDVNELDRLEYNLINSFPTKYMLNRTIGGKPKNARDIVDRIFLRIIYRDWENINLDGIDVKSVDERFNE